MQRSEGDAGLRFLRILGANSSVARALLPAAFDSDLACGLETGQSQQSGTAAFVLGSPPYCTRIDYAMTTCAELSLLGFGRDSGFRDLRRELVGSATVPKVIPRTSEKWGSTCLGFLETLRQHTSKASATYYYKNHLQYFRSLSASIQEISRVLKPEGRCVLVVQDSYYKDLHNDLPVMLAEMATSRGLALEERCDFPLSRTMAGINPGSKGYRVSFSATESVLVFGKQFVQEQRRSITFPMSSSQSVAMF